MHLTWTSTILISTFSLPFLALEESRAPFFPSISLSSPLSFSETTLPLRQTKQLGREREKPYTPIARRTYCLHVNTSWKPSKSIYYLVCLHLWANCVVGFSFCLCILATHNFPGISFQANNCNILLAVNCCFGCYLFTRTVCFCVHRIFVRMRSFAVFFYRLCICTYATVLLHAARNMRYKWLLLFRRPPSFMLGGIIQSLAEQEAHIYSIHIVIF